MIFLLSVHFTLGVEKCLQTFFPLQVWLNVREYEYSSAVKQMQPYKGTDSCKSICRRELS